MTPDTLPNRVFFCLIILLITIALCTSGCHSTKHTWFPEPISKEVGSSGVNVVGVEF